jgi:hypothetical protein
MRTRPATVVAMALLVAAVALVIGFAIARPGGLPSRAVSSVPALLSEPAGIPGSDLILAANGLGLVTFGEGEDEVMAALTESLGPPVEDAPQPCDSETDLVRWVRWGSLSVAFPDGRFGGYVTGIYFPPDSPELPIQTEAGVGLHVTVDQLTAAYGDRLAWYGQEETGFENPIDAFGIDGYDVEHPTPTGLGGYVEGGREAGVVITFLAGQSCGP